MQNLDIAVVCINLPRRPDRLSHFKAQMSGYEFILFPAIDGEKIDSYSQNEKIFPFLQLSAGAEIVSGELGCKLSHYLVLDLIANENLPNVLVLEDDIIANENRHIHEICEGIDLGSFCWDLIYVGGQWTQSYGIGADCHIKEQKIQAKLDDFLQENTSSFYKRAQQNFDLWNSPYFRTAGAYVVNTKSSQKILSLIHENKLKFLSCPWDMWLLEMQSNGSLVSYDFFPHIFYQGGFDITPIQSLLKNDIHRGFYQEFRLNKTPFGDFVFFQGKDIMDNDMGKINNDSLQSLLEDALHTSGCIGVNTLGFKKNKIAKLVASPYFGAYDGIYIKKKIFGSITVVIYLFETNNKNFCIYNLFCIPQMYNIIVIHDDSYAPSDLSQFAHIIHIHDISVDLLKEKITTEKVIILNDCENQPSYLDNETCFYCIHQSNMFVFSNEKSFLYIVSANVYLSGIIEMYTQESALLWLFNWAESIKADINMISMVFDDICYKIPQEPKKIQFSGHYWGNAEDILKEFNLMCNFRNCIFGDTLLVSSDPDFWIIINEPNPEDIDKIEVSKSLYFCLEPITVAFPWISMINKNELYYYHDPNCNFNAGQWKMDTINIKFLPSCDLVKENKVSSILSSKLFHEGHILRLELLRYIDSHSSILHVYGKENYFNLRSYMKPVDYYMQHTVLLPYKYYLMPENNNLDYYVTEKVWEPILCECVCFYWGCPNLSQFIDERCIIRLDIQNLEESYQTIANAIENNEWEKRIDAIRKAKKWILENAGILSIINSVL